MKIEPENYLILIVDDTETNIRLISHVLKKEGYKIESAHNGESAIQKTKEIHPDLILLDVMMPDISGFEVSSKLKEFEEFSEIPIIFLSALSESDVKVKGFKSGGVDYITKPIKKEETLARIRTHLYLRTLQQRLNDRIHVLKEREMELSKLNRQKDDLVRMVSHDIKNPLTGILGLVKLMKKNDDITAEERKHMFSVIEESGNRLMNLVKDVLDQEGRKGKEQKLELKKTKISDLMEQVIQLNKAKAEYKQINLNVDINLSDDELLVDPGKLEIAISNLVSNALKFTYSGGEVSIHVSEKSDQILEIIVKDTGIGMSEKTRKNLFVADKRNSTLGTSGEAGIGLGLDIVQHYIEMHEGKIRVESELHEGTRFYIDLPLIKN